MERSEQRSIIEALILTAPEPIAALRIADVIPYCKPAKVRELVQELNAEYAEQGRAFSFVVVEETGMVSIAVARDGVTVSVFGACTPASR